jgi:hypothetical protein
MLINRSAELCEVHQDGRITEWENGVMARINDEILHTHLLTYSRAQLF